MSRHALAGFVQTYRGVTMRCAAHVCWFEDPRTHRPVGVPQAEVQRHIDHALGGLGGLDNMLVTGTMLAKKGLCTEKGHRFIQWACPPKGGACGTTCQMGRRAVAGLVPGLPIVCGISGARGVESMWQKVCGASDATVKQVATRAAALVESKAQPAEPLDGAFGDFFPERHSTATSARSAAMAEIVVAFIRAPIEVRYDVPALRGAAVAIRYVRRVDLPGMMAIDGEWTGPRAARQPLQKALEGLLQSRGLGHALVEVLPTGEVRVAVSDPSNVR